MPGNKQPGRIRVFDPHRELVEVARGRGVRSEVVRLLEELPERRYRHVRELWAHVPEVPVGT
ncbi:MAG: DUF2795 domain-containing protein [Actinomycetota bacterium]